MTLKRTKPGLPGTINPPALVGKRSAQAAQLPKAPGIKAAWSCPAGAWDKAHEPEGVLQLGLLPGCKFTIKPSFNPQPPQLIEVHNRPLPHQSSCTITIATRDQCQMP